MLDCPRTVLDGFGTVLDSPIHSKKSSHSKNEYFFVLERVILDNQTVSVLFLLRFCLVFASLDSFGGTK